MTISEEKRTKILELYNKGVSKKDIVRIEEISYPTIRNILSENNKEQNQEELQENHEIIEKKLSEIFSYENYTEKSILDLIFNLRRIGENAGRDLGAFVDDIEFIFDKYNKHTDNPIKLLDFLLDISNELSLIFDLIEPKEFLSFVEKYYERGIFLNDTETYIKDEIIPTLDSYIAKKEFLENEIIIMQEKITNLTSMEAILTKKLLEKPNLEKLKNAELNINNLKALLSKVANETVKHKTENIKIKNLLKETISINNQLKEENSALDMVFDKIRLIFPEEVKSIVSEVNRYETEKLQS